MLEGDEFLFIEYNCFVVIFFELEIVNGIFLICEVCSVKIFVEIELFCCLGVVYVKVYD